MKTSCALIGPGVGPLVKTGGAGTVRVRGLPEGEVAWAEVEGREALELCNGEHVFSACEELQVSYAGEAGGFIALVMVGEA